MPYNFDADSFHTKKLCSRLSSSEVQFCTQIGRFAFMSPFFGGLGAPYGVYVWLIRKRVLSPVWGLSMFTKRIVDFLLLLIERFC